MTGYDLTSRFLASRRHTTSFWEAGRIGGPLMVFLHGWPVIGLIWRAQMQAFAAAGWHCVAPNMRGYTGSSAPASPEASELREIVQDVVELARSPDRATGGQGRARSGVPRFNLAVPGLFIRSSAVYLTAYSSTERWHALGSLEANTPVTLPPQSIVTISLNAN